MTDERLQNTPEDVLTGRALPPEMLQDFLLIAQLDKRICESIAQSLHRLSGMPDADAIDTAVRGAAASDEVAKSVVRTLRGVSQSKLQKYLDALNGWVFGRTERSELFTTETLRNLSENLAILIDKYHSVELMQKADQLLRDVGNEIEDVKFVCDLRPVFDDPRENVEAFVAIATMGLIYQQQDGSRNSCEIALTEAELKSLHERAETAIKKMEVLERLRSTLVVPGTEDGEK